MNIFFYLNIISSFKIISMKFSSLLCLVLYSGDVAAQLSFDCGSTDETCLNAVNQQGEPQGCSVDCGPCTFYFYCAPQNFNPISGEGPGCFVYWECPGLADGQAVDITITGKDEGLNSGGVQTFNGNILYTLWDDPISAGFFNMASYYGVPGLQQNLYISITDISTGQTLCETQYYYKCY